MVMASLVSTNKQLVNQGFVALAAKQCLDKLHLLGYGVKSLNMEIYIK